jgi:hypothetical protein
MHHFWPLKGCRLGRIKLLMKPIDKTIHGCFPPISDLLKIFFPKPGSEAAAVHLKLSVVDVSCKFIRVHEFPSQSILAFDVKCPA